MHVPIRRSPRRSRTNITALTWQVPGISVQADGDGVPRNRPLGLMTPTVRGLARGGSGVLADLPAGLPRARRVWSGEAAQMINLGWAQAGASATAAFFASLVEFVE